VSEEEAMQSDRMLGISLTIIGVTLFFVGVSVSHSLSSEFSEQFQGAPSDKAIVWMVVGALLVVVGLLKSLRRRATKA
jgi:uncharacterized membrane protein